MRIYRHWQDILPSLYVLAVLALQLWLFFTIDQIGYLALAGFLMLFPYTTCGAVCHNHHHVNTFTVAWMNRLLECMMFWQTGTSPLSWTLHHNIGHHQLYLDQSQDPANWREADGRLMSRFKYDVWNALKIYPEICRIGEQHPVLYARFRRWLWLASAPVLVFLALWPLKTLIFFLLPMAFMLVLLLDNTWFQHSGLSTESHFVASRNILNRFYNLSSLNLGYHTAHHYLPGMHWSQLPELHARIAQQIPPELVSSSILPRAWEAEGDLKRDLHSFFPRAADTDARDVA